MVDVIIILQKVTDKNVIDQEKIKTKRRKEK